MNVLTGFVKFWYDFIVGDDWRVAVAVVVALVLTALLARARRCVAAPARRRPPHPRRQPVARREIGR